MPLGLTHIYTGDGKGKSTAACGLALRAYGAGLCVKIVRFLKSAESGECKAIARLGGGIEVKYFETSHKFLWEMDSQEKQTLRRQVRQAFEFCMRTAREHGCDLLVMDEAIGAVHAGFLSEEELLSLIEQKDGAVELVLTGRNAPESLVEKADYVSELRAVKHPYEKGIAARKGIEF